MLFFSIDPKSLAPISSLRFVALFIATILVVGFQSGCLKDLPDTGGDIEFTDLSSFEPAADNWMIVGVVVVDRSGEKLMSGSPGAGVLFCAPTETAKDNLFTKFEHADIELEVELMVPVKSNSGIYFQGRYEAQILDSWGVTKPRHADIGGIYQRWDPLRGEGKEGYEGHAPRVNAAKEPGEWQSYRIVFRAPRFDADGNKTENARFEEVRLNGQLVQKDVEVTGPTRASPFEDEVPVDAIMIQGDHGPVAFRNFSYRLLP